MKSLLITLFFCLSAVFLFAQDSLLQSKNEYLIVLIETRSGKKVSMEIDNGTRIETLKDENGRPLVLPTTAAALNYLSDRGWALFMMKKIDAISTDKVHYVLRRKKS